MNMLPHTMSWRRNNSQRGIALGPILWILAIIAILAAAIAAGSSGFTTNTNTDSAKVLAQAIVDYAEQVKSGVNIIQANGCGDLSTSTSSINFYSPSAPTNYVNPYAPADHSCDVFDVRGGGVGYKTVPTAALITGTDSATNQYVNDYDYGYYSVYSEVSLLNAGVDHNVTPFGSGNDLILMVPYLTNAVCLQIDNMFGISSIPSIPTTMITIANSSWHFSGTFWTGGAAFQIPYAASSQCINAQFSQNGQPINGVNIAYFLLQAR